MEQVLLVVQAIIASALIGMVLVQRSDTDGFGLGSGGGSGLLSGRAKANLMTRTTAIIATLFIVNSLILSVMAAHRHTPSIVDAIEKEQATTTSVGDKKDSSDSAKADAVKKVPAIPSVPNADEVKPVKKVVRKPTSAPDVDGDSNKSSDEKSE